MAVAIEPFRSRALGALANMGVFREDLPVTSPPMALARMIRERSVPAWKAFTEKYDYPRPITATNYPRE